MRHHGVAPSRGGSSSVRDWPPNDAPVPTRDLRRGGVAIPTDSCRDRWDAVPVVRSQLMPCPICGSQLRIVARRQDRDFYDCDLAHHASTPAEEWESARARALRKEIERYVPGPDDPTSGADCGGHVWIEIDQTSRGEPVLECPNCTNWTVLA
jgi:ribosomal protein L37AE/L43A